MHGFIYLLDADPDSSHLFVLKLEWCTLVGSAWNLGGPGWNLGWSSVALLLVQCGTFVGPVWNLQVSQIRFSCPPTRSYLVGEQSEPSLGAGQKTSYCHTCRMLCIYVYFCRTFIHQKVHRRFYGLD